MKVDIIDELNARCKRTDEEVMSSAALEIDRLRRKVDQMGDLLVSILHDEETKLGVGLEAGLNKMVSSNADLEAKSEREKKEIEEHRLVL